jgi:UDP-N-acetylglucosamine transferase subunit ALG13
MRLGLALVVVPNMTLLDNHQDELAKELEAQGYVTKSDTRYIECPAYSKSLIHIYPVCECC